MNRSFQRLVAALVLALFLNGEVLSRGFWAFGDFGTILFPYLWFYLIVESLSARSRLKDIQLFLLGGAFSFLYDGLFTKRMQDGLSLVGLDWFAILGGPFEWGMIAVVWFHCLDAVFPRKEAAGKGFLRTAVITAISLGAIAGYLWKTTYGHYRVQNMLGPLWFLDDIVLACAAWGMWRLSQKSFSEKSQGRPLWLWGLAGAGLWLLGFSLLAQVFSGYSPKAAYAIQIVWLGGIAYFLRSVWQCRCFDDKVVRLSRPVLAAAAFRVAGTLLLLLLFGSGWDVRTAFWSGILCRGPSLMLFYGAFLTSKLEV